MSEKLNVLQTSRLLRSVVVGKPDFVYERSLCMYREADGQPSCIVGQVVAAAGLDLCALTEGLRAHKQESLKLWFTPGAIRLLQVAQSAQDLGVPWGLAASIAACAISEEDE